MIKLAGISLLLSSSLIFKQPVCPCEKFPFGEWVQWGHMTITVLEEKPLRKIQGRVLGELNEPIADARIYVWRRPAGVSDEQFSKNKLKDEDGLLACTTSEDGRFCFEDVPSGKYVVCVTSSSHNSTCSLVTIKSNSKRKGFDIPLQLGS